MNLLLLVMDVILFAIGGTLANIAGPMEHAHTMVVTAMLKPEGIRTVPPLATRWEVALTIGSQ